MTVKLRTPARTAMAAAIISDAGTNPQLRWYNGTEPAGLAAVTVGNTLLSVDTCTGPLGVANAGAIDFDEEAIEQTPASNVAGTPTFVDVTSSAGVLVARVGLDGAGAGGWTWTGAIAVGQIKGFTDLSWVMPGAEA